MRRLILLWLLLAGVLSAHQIAEVSMSLALEGDRMTAIADADAAYMLPEFRGDEDQEAKDLAWLRQQGPEGWQKIVRECDLYWRGCLHLKADGQEISWSLRVPELQKETPSFLEEGDPEELPMLAVQIEATLPKGSSKLSIDWKEPFGVNLIVTTGDGDTAEVKPLVSGEEAVVAERAATEVDMRPTETPFTGWILLGFTHILPEGTDHILFVLGLFLLVPRWKPLLQQTIVFTLAHSLSLAAAVLGWVNVSPPFVELLIASSIAWIGIENFWAKELGKGRLILVGIFGIVHGLGFAGWLAGKLPTQPEKLPAALLGFNIGVEFGQIALLAMAFAAFAWWGEKRFIWVKRIGSAIVGLAGLFFLVQRAGTMLSPAQKDKKEARAITPALPVKQSCWSDLSPQREACGSSSAPPRGS